MNMVEKYLEEHAKAMKEIYGYEDKVDVFYETKLYGDKGSGLFFGIYPDSTSGRNMDKDPYFKVSWKPITRTSPDVARISMVDGDYYRKEHYGKSVKVPDYIVDQLNVILPSPCLANGYTHYTNWQAMLSQIATNYGIRPEVLIEKFPFVTINLVNFPENAKVIKWK